MPATYALSEYKIMMVRDSSFVYPETPLSSPECSHVILDHYLKGADREHLVVLLLNTQRQFIGIHTVSIGNINSAIVSAREVFKPAILGNAAAIILGHNHPSGNPTPSREDILVTKNLAKAGDYLQIKLLDHVIIGQEGRFTSLKDSNLI